MKRKPDVNATGVHDAIWYALGVIDNIRRSTLGDEVVVANLVAGRGYTSLHPSGKAVDIRMNDLAAPARNTFATAVKEALDLKGFDVVLEPDWLSDATLKAQGRNRAEIVPHLHVEYDPKGAEDFFPALS